MPWLCPSWVKFLILNVALKVSRRKTRIFSLRGFSCTCCRWNVYRCALIPRKLSCPEKFLVTRLQQHGSKAIFVQFVNWRVAEEIKSKVIQLNAQKRTKVVVNQMYSKELTIRRNNALKRRRETLEEDGSIQIKLVYPAILKFKNKGSKNRWETLEVF